MSEAKPQKLYIDRGWLQDEFGLGFHLFISPTRYREYYISIVLGWWFLDISYFPH